MSQAQSTFDAYKAIGVFANLTRASVSFNRDSKLWEVHGRFQNANGIRWGKLASFDEVDQAVEFEVLIEQR